MAPATRWGIVGAGRICNDFVAVLSTMPREDHQVYSLSHAGRRFENAKKFAALHNVPKVYSSYEELARDPNVGLIELRVQPGAHICVPCDRNDMNDIAPGQR